MAKKEGRHWHQQCNKKWVTGAGRKPKLDDLEGILAVVNLYLQKLKVTRTFIKEHAKHMAEDTNINDFKGSGHWIILFLGRNGFSLRQTTN